jgi:hypothetical protein
MTKIKSIVPWPVPPMRQSFKEHEQKIAASEQLMADNFRATAVKALTYALNRAEDNDALARRIVDDIVKCAVFEASIASQKAWDAAKANCLK